MAFKERLTILLEPEIKDLYSIPTLSVEQKRVIFALNDPELACISSIRDRNQKCLAIALLGYFKVKPILLNIRFNEVHPDLKFIATEYFPKFNITRFSVNRMQKARLYQKVLDVLGFKNWSSDYENSLQIHLQSIAKSSIEPRYLFDASIEYLAHNKIAIPKYTVLQRIISKTINIEKLRLLSILKDAVSTELSYALNKLITGENSIALHEIRQHAKSFTPSELEKELKTHNYMRSWMDDIYQVSKQLNLSFKNQQYFSSMVDYYTITKLKRFDVLTQQLYLICYFQERHHTIVEHLADGFIYHARKLREKAKDYAKEMSYKDWKDAASNVGKAAELLHFFIDDSIDGTQPFENIRSQAQDLLKARDIESLCLYLTKQKRALDDYIWEYYDQKTELIEHLLRPILLSIEFQASTTTHALAHQITVTQKEFKNLSMLETFDQRLILPRHKPYVIPDGEVDAQRFEILLYLTVQSKLDGQLYIPGSIKYRALQDDLISEEHWKDKNKLIKSSLLSRINTAPSSLMRTMEKELSDKLINVGERIKNGDNHNVILRDRSGKTKWRIPTTGVKSMLNNPFFEQLKPVNIAELLRFVDKNTEFLSCFEHVRKIQSGQSGNMNDLLASIIGNGTNYGLYGMASISDRSYEQLRSVQANYLRPETLNQANDKINNAIAKLEIFKHYNIQEGVIHASADGQKFESRLETFKTRYSSKYFGTNKGVSAITLIANHAALNARVIGSNEHESHYIFDLLYNNTSDIKPDVLSTDTHGVNHVNFALLDLFGYTFAPRYAQFGKIIEDMFIVNDTDDKKQMLVLKKPINTQLIEQEWETIQRIIISLQQKTMTQATLVRKLSGYSKNHSLLQALTEYNRLIKAKYILDYIDDASLRGYVQRALNRGEAYHQLRRAIASVNGNKFRGSSDYEIELWNECARLLTNAIIYFNSLILSQLLTYFEEISDGEKLELTKKVSPVAWHNINLNGTYSFSFEQNMLDLAEIMKPLTENSKKQ